MQLGRSGRRSRGDCRSSDTTYLAERDRRNWLLGNGGELQKRASKEGERVENLTIPAGRCGTQSRSPERLEEKMRGKGGGASATKSVIPHSRYYLAACTTRYKTDVHGFPPRRAERAYISVHRGEMKELPTGHFLPQHLQLSRALGQRAISPRVPNPLSTPTELSRLASPFYNPRRRFVEMQKG